jgi:5-formyltetrahydrofolate cyclo-ligase
MTDADLTAAKAAARKAAFAARAVAHAAGQGDACATLSAVLARHAGKVLAGYMPMRSEIDPLPAMAAHQGPVCVPVILGKGQPLAFRAWTPDARMVPGDFGALIPESGDWLTPQVLIVPLVAFDGQGGRLGYGGGYYDRTLEALRAKGPVTAIGFAYTAQHIGQVPLEPTDQRLDLIVTDRGMIDPRPVHMRLI